MVKVHVLQVGDVGVISVQIYVQDVSVFVDRFWFSFLIVFIVIFI